MSHDKHLLDAQQPLDNKGALFCHHSSLTRRPRTEGVMKVVLGGPESPARTPAGPLAHPIKTFNLSFSLRAAPTLDSSLNALWGFRIIANPTGS